MKTFEKDNELHLHFEVGVTLDDGSTETRYPSFQLVRATYWMDCHTTTACKPFIDLWVKDMPYMAMAINGNLCKGNMERLQARLRADKSLTPNERAAIIEWFETAETILPDFEREAEEAKELPANSVDFSSKISFYLDVLNNKSLAFDAVEIHPCQSIDNYVEQCEPEEAHFWSVYFHIAGEGLTCIADCDTQETAIALETLLENVMGFNETKEPNKAKTICLDPSTSYCDTCDTCTPSVSESNRECCICGNIKK